MKSVENERFLEPSRRPTFRKNELLGRIRFLNESELIELIAEFLKDSYENSMLAPPFGIHAWSRRKKVQRYFDLRRRRQMLGVMGFDIGIPYFHLEKCTGGAFPEYLVTMKNKRGMSNAWYRTANYVESCYVQAFKQFAFGEIGS